MAERLEFVPLQEISAEEAREVGADVHTLVMNPDVTNMLEARNLLGVIKRHTVSADASAESLADSWWQARQGTAYTYVIQSTLEGVKRVAGLATGQPGLPLHEQHRALPKQLTRRVSFLHSVIETPAVNVAAWTDERRVNTLGFQEDMRQSYGFLRQEFKDSWTLATDVPIVGQSYDRALETAGFVATSWGRYDDMKPGLQAVPQSRLYVSQEAA